MNAFGTVTVFLSCYIMHHFNASYISTSPLPTAPPPPALNCTEISDSFVCCSVQNRNLQNETLPTIIRCIWIDLCCYSSQRPGLRPRQFCGRYWFNERHSGRFILQCLWFPLSQSTIHNCSALVFTARNVPDQSTYSHTQSLSPIIQRRSATHKGRWLLSSIVICVCFSKGCRIFFDSMRLRSNNSWTIFYAVKYSYGFIQGDLKVSTHMDNLLI